MYVYVLVFVKLFPFFKDERARGGFVRVVLNE